MGFGWSLDSPNRLQPSAVGAPSNALMDDRAESAAGRGTTGDGHQGEEQHPDRSSLPPRCARWLGFARRLTCVLDQSLQLIQKHRGVRILSRHLYEETRRSRVELRLEQTDGRGLARSDPARSRKIPNALI